MKRVYISPRTVCQDMYTEQTIMAASGVLDNGFAMSDEDFDSSSDTQLSKRYGGFDWDEEE